jgi:hypothetical protein
VSNVHSDGTTMCAHVGPLTPFCAAPRRTRSRLCEESSRWADHALRSIHHLSADVQCRVSLLLALSRACAGGQEQAKAGSFWSALVLQLGRCLALQVLTVHVPALLCAVLLGRRLTTRVDEEHSGCKAQENEYLSACARCSLVGLLTVPVVARVLVFGKARGPTSPSQRSGRARRQATSSLSTDSTHRAGSAAINMRCVALLPLRWTQEPARE